MPQETDEGARLDSWKEIARYLGRGVRTVQRWERTEGLPVRRLQHGRLGSIFAIRGEIDAWRDARSVRPAARPRRTTLLILPLKDLSGEPGQEFFGDGLTEELISQVGRVRPEKLGVIAYSTAAHYRGDAKPLAEITRELRVDYVLQGSVRRAGGRVRITAQLVHATDQTQRWSESYDRPLTDILRLQSDVAGNITRELLLVLGGRRQVGQPRQVAASQVNARAYEAYLKGRYLSHSLDPGEIAASVGCYRKAVEKAPRFALAYCGLADSCALLAMAPFDLWEPPRPCRKRRRRRERRSSWIAGWWRLMPRWGWCCITIAGNGRRRKRNIRAHSR